MHKIVLYLSPLISWHLVSASAHSHACSRSENYENYWLLNAYLKTIRYDIQIDYSAHLQNCVLIGQQIWNGCQLRSWNVDLIWHLMSIKSHYAISQTSIKRLEVSIIWYGRSSSVKRGDRTLRRRDTAKFVSVKLCCESRLRFLQLFEVDSADREYDDAEVENYKDSGRVCTSRPQLDGVQESEESLLKASLFSHSIACSHCCIAAYKDFNWLIKGASLCEML